MLNVGKITTAITKRSAVCAMLAALTLAATSCSDAPAVWKQTLTIDNYEWNCSQDLVYTIPISDTLSWFNLVFDLRNRGDYPYSNIYLFVTTEAPNGAFAVDTVHYRLFDDSGTEKGRTALSQFAENRFPFRSRIRFPVKGNYTIKIRHGMRNETLTGIASLSLRLEN